MKSSAYSAFVHPYDGSIIFYKHSTNSTFFPAAIQPSGFILYPKFLSFGYGWLSDDYYESTVKSNTIFTAQSRNDLISKCSRKYLLKHHPEALL
jgi:hypothetical protein